ncbi:MAG: alpha/beta hydrolase [Pseudomonadota bacterium]
MLDRPRPNAGNPKFLPTSDGNALLFRSWQGDKECPTVLIGHSQPTHSGHYLDIANAFNAAGWTVHAGDLRGHGGSVGCKQPLAHLDKDAGWDLLIEDMELFARRAFDGVPFEKRVLAVQNISGLLALEVLKRKPDLAQHIMISVPAKQKVTAMLARGFAQARLKFKAADVPDEQTLHHLYSFHGTRLKERKHLADVMSADRNLVDAIVADPAGFPTPTLGYWSSIFKGNDVAWDWPKAKRIHPQTRFLLLHGAEDSVNTHGFSRPIADWLRKAGAGDVSYHRVEGGRTAILLDERTLGVSAIIRDWVGSARGYSDDGVLNNACFEELSKTVLSDLGCDVDTANAFQMESLITLCYDAIDDETRWVEVLYRISLALSQKDAASLNDIEDELRALMPHWDRAYQINKQVMSNAALGIILQSVIDRLGIGTALLSDQQTILYSNEIFNKTICELITPAAEPHDSVAAATALNSAMDEKFRVGLQRGDGEQVLTVGGHAVGFYFKPDALRRVAAREGGPAGLLILRAPGASCSLEHSQTRLSMLELAYGLTRQEATVALEIAGGHSPASIADTLEVSVNTVRTHLKRGYEKMGVEGQTEMAARIMSGPIGWLVR